MVMKESTMLPLGVPAPDFTLPDTDGSLASLSDFANAPALLVIFLCNHCPYVIHVRDEIKRLTDEYMAKGVGVVGICSNSIETHPQDGPDKMAEEKKNVGYAFPYLFDESQEIAKAYCAACTPDFYVFNKERLLVYRGQLDDSRPGNDIPVTGKDLRAALDAVLAGEPLSVDQKPSAGCNIKWKPGNEPDYF
jgi:peroxiredoxin